jgi:LysM repeat protein
MQTGKAQAIKIRLLGILGLYCISIGPSYSQKFTAKDYIEKYKSDALKDMARTGVPASITLAQGMLESENGNSTLALMANNHFGIKCHKDWTGSAFYKDDDAKQECFRKYKTVLESFDDHSDFLKTHKRYAFLFEIERSNYKGWAEGLKRAGYATNPFYPQLLIKIIEDNQLYELDQPNNFATDAGKQESVAQKVAHGELTLVNRVPSFIVRKGETLVSLAARYDLDLWQIYKYNDLEKNTEIKEGQRLFVKPKRRRGPVDFHFWKANETMYSISQFYGMKLKHLYRKNRMSKEDPLPEPGTKIWLRSRKPAP